MGARRGRRGRSLIGLKTAFTPWITGLGLLVSFTASAGTGTPMGSGPMPGDGHIVPALPAGTALIGANLRHGAVSPRREGGASLLFANLTGNVTGLLTPGAATWNPELEPDTGFVPVPDLGLGRRDADATTDDGGTADIEERRYDGSTPPVPRAVALSSTTPAPADATPVEVAAASLMLPGFFFRTDRPEAPVAQSVPMDARHRYADLIGADAMDKEQRCLAEAVYFESRSEPEAGQAAVAQVVLNRVKSGLYPSNVCGVVYQNRHRYLGCQFSFACEGKALRITDSGSWAIASRIAQSVIEGRTYLAEVGDATHYHADYVKPGWSRRLRKMDAIGRHIFYELKPGQT